ncbi:MAG: hypothetical protein PHI47_06325 [Sulfuricurvum sp.]|uniref:hypothetical protein n=1 Tax=Sulfuricurvum sp. TaxID=2025608 RepID=UPI002610146B|nr:hypothetical protein [Sulfuricurvum sp.]MDD5159649.1 hypothetical protein [Sulfuricurvum sp.]
MKPAIFNNEMVRAILDDRKTNTRRPFTFKKCIRDYVKSMGQDYCLKHQNKLHGEYDWSIRERSGVWADYTHQQFLDEYAPYKVGDIIYVRETWAEVFEIEYIDFGVCEREIKNISDCISNFESISKIQVGMSNRCSPPNAEERMRYIVYKAENLEYTNKKYKLLWTPSIHMPKEYARLFLRVKDVRIERLNEINSADAKAEGIDEKNITDAEVAHYMGYTCDAYVGYYDHEYTISAFAKLWESIYGNGSFDNRYVWVIEFERISKEEAMSGTAT